MSTLGNEVICTCRAILRLGAREMSGSSMPSGGFSGSSWMASSIASMLDCIDVLCLSEFA